MSIHDELIAKTLMAKPETDEDYLNIDWDTRLITIPSTLTNIGVYNDKDTNRLYFRCPVEYGEFKIADFGLRVNYQNTGISTTKYDGDVYFVDDVESDGDYLTFSWLVGRHAYLEQGTTAFIVCCKVIDSDENVVNELNTTIAILDVLEGLEVDVLPPEEYPDYLEELLRRVEAAEDTANSVDAKATEALDTANKIADTALTGVDVNGDPAEVIDHRANIEAATPEDLSRVESAIPTKVSQLNNDAGYTTESYVDAEVGNVQNNLDKLEDKAITGVDVNGDPAPVIEHRANIEAATPEELNRVQTTAEAAETTATEALNKATAVEDSAIQGVNVNGTAAEVVDHIAQISVSGGWEIGYCPASQRLIATGDTMFGILFGEEEADACAISIARGNYGWSKNLEDHAEIEYNGEAITMLMRENLFFIIFGADSIVID